MFFLYLQCGQTNNIMIMTPQYPVHVVHNHEDSKNNVTTYDTICYINIYNCIIYHIIAGLPRGLHMFSVWDVRWVPLSSTGTPRPFQLVEYQWREDRFDLICVGCRCFQHVKKSVFLPTPPWNSIQWASHKKGCRKNVFGLFWPLKSPSSSFAYVLRCYLRSKKGRCSRLMMNSFFSLVISTYNFQGCDCDPTADNPDRWTQYSSPSKLLGFLLLFLIARRDWQYICFLNIYGIYAKRFFWTAPIYGTWLCWRKSFWCCGDACVQMCTLASTTNSFREHCFN